MSYLARNNKNISKNIVTIILFTMSIIVFAQNPQINNVSGTILDGQQITITGSNFGANGPNIVLFDDFKRGTDGEDITLTATIGNWNVRNHPPTYGKDSRNNIAGRFIGDGGGRLIAQFADTQEIFVSYRVQIPLGKHFPHSFAPNTFPSGSQWKLTWLMDGDRGAQGNDDLCIPTWGNGTYFSIAGNDNAYQLQTGRPSNDTNWFSFLDWNRFSVYMKGGANPTVDSGKVWAQGMSEEFGQKVFGSTDRRLFDGDDTPDGYQFEDDAISRWNRLNIPGWHRGGDDNAAAMYDDIYIATGDFAQARIEIGNKPVYNNCDVLAIGTPTSWQDNVITTTVRQGSLQGEENAYLFVIDQNGNVSDGYLLETGTLIIENNNLSIFSIFPSPSRNSEITIELSEITAIKGIKIYDIAGKVIFSKEIEVSQKQFIIKPNLTSGIYIVSLLSQNKGPMSKKIIIE